MEHSIKKTKRKVSERRRALLAKAHIAKKDLCILEADYRDILMREFGVESARDLTDAELVSLIKYWEEKGWRPGASGRRPAAGDHKAQVEALRDRAIEIVLHSSFNDKRWRGLLRKFCGVEDINWCHDARALKRLLAALKNIVDQEVVYD